MPWPPTAPNAWSCSTGLAIHADPVWARQVGRAIADFVRVPFEDQLSSARKSLPAGPGPRPVLSRSLFFPIPGCALLTSEAIDGFGGRSGTVGYSRWSGVFRAQFLQVACAQVLCK